MRRALGDLLDRCGDCGAVTPRIGGVPLLFEDSSAVLSGWASQRTAFSRETEATRANILAQRAGADLHEGARRRLALMYEALAVHHRRVDTLLGDAGIATAEAVSAGAPGDHVPGEGTTTAYFHQVHRDWAWDDAEVQRATEVVLDTVDAHRPRRMLVLGAGACRLPYELHRAWGCELTVAVDINPLPFLIARQLLQGNPLSMFEFPVSPRASRSVAVDRTLAATDPQPAGFEFLFADGLRPPVVEGAFDAVLTPWFIDQVPKDLATLVDTVAELLAPGGLWINHGPLLYHPSHTMLAHRYRQDEVLEIVGAAGFDVTRHRWDRMLYMQSPDGSQGRTEGVLSFAAQRNSQPRRERSDAAPSWSEQTDLAIERWPQLDSYEAPHPMFAAVARLVDGARSAQDIATVMVERFGLPEDAALGGVRTCLLEMWRAARSDERTAP